MPSSPAATAEITEPVTREPMGLYPARVVGAVQLSPHMRRITLAGERLAAMPFAGPDQRVKLLLPLPGQDAPQVEESMGVREIFGLPDGVRPIIRTYTIRRHRPAAAEVDIDFAQHGTTLGPASAWAGSARPGDRAAIYGPAAEYAPPAGVAWQLIVGDETALPAIGAIVESLGRGVRARVVVEVPEAADVQTFDTAADLDVSWLTRDGVPAHHSGQLLEAVRGTPRPDAPSYFWLAGESSIVTSIRRHLVRDCGVPREAVMFTGYWKHGVNEDNR